MRADAGSVEDACAGVVGRLRARRAELVQAIFARVRDGVFSPVGATDARYVEGLHAAVEAAVEYALEGIERGEGWAGPIPALAIEQARRAARMGVSLDTVLRRYVVGHTLLGEFVMAEAERGGRDALTSGQRGAVLVALRAQAVVLDRLLVAITRAYGLEQEQADRSPEQRRVARVRGLLEEGLLAAGELERDVGDDPGRDLDYRLGGWHVGVIAVSARPGRVGGAAAAVRELARKVGCRLLCVEQDAEGVWAWLGAGERLVLADVEGVGTGVIACVPDYHCEPAPRASDGVVFALGEPAEGFQGWRMTHRQARAALVVARRRRRPQRFTRYRDVALLAGALKDQLLSCALSDVYLAPLQAARDNGAVLRETLRAYLATERSVSSTAAALGVGRKTVENRLRAIEARLGCTLHPFPAELEIALQLDELACR